MILKFPSGSIPKTPDVIAGLYFKNDGSWFLKTIEDIEPDYGDEDDQIQE